VIRFEQKEVGAAQVVLDGFGDVAEVGGDADAYALGIETEADGVDGIVRDAEALHLDIADLETGAGLERLEDGDGFVPVNGRTGEAREVERRRFLETAREDGKAGDVVGMLVGDEDGVERMEVLTDRGKAFAELAHTEPGVDENARFVGSEEGSVPGAAAR
jgi:hypothetical protein